MIARAAKAGFNLRHYDDQTVGISLDESTTLQEVLGITALFITSEGVTSPVKTLDADESSASIA